MMTTTRQAVRELQREMEGNDDDEADVSTKFSFGFFDLHLNGTTSILQLATPKPRKLPTPFSNDAKLTHILLDLNITCVHLILYICKRMQKV